MEMSGFVRKGGVALGLVFGSIWLAPAEGRAALPQAETADTVDLTLAQALAIAEGNNPAYRRAVNQLDVGGAESRAVWMGTVLPSVRVNLLNTGYYGNRVLQTQDNFGNPIANNQSGWLFSSRTSQSIGLSWSIQGKNLIDALKRLDVDESGRELAVESAGLDVTQNVRRQYFAVLRERELLEVEMTALDGRLSDQEVAEQKFRYAQATRLDVLRAEFAVEEQSRAIRQGQRSLDQARVDLRTTLGDLDLGLFRVRAEPIPLFDPSDLRDEALVGRALMANPLVLQEEGNLEGAHLAVSDAKANRWPTLSLSYDLGREAQGREAAGLFDVTHESNDLSNRFSVFLTFPYLSNYFGNRSNEVQAEVTRRNQQETIRETRLQVEREVRTQLIALRNAHETLMANRRTLAIAEEALRLAREQYRLGTVTFEGLQDLVDAEHDARLLTINASYSFHEALLNLEAAVGGPVRPDGPITGPDPVGPR